MIVLTDPATPSDVTRKTKLRLSVLQMIGQVGIGVGGLGLVLVLGRGREKPPHPP